MPRLLLDTTVLIDVLRGRPAGGRIVDLRRAGDVPLTSAINVEEVVRGLHDDERRVASRLFDGLRIVPIGRDGGGASRGVAPVVRLARDHAGPGGLPRRCGSDHRRGDARHSERA